MEAIEKIRKYISKRGAPRDPCHDASLKEILALASEMSSIEAVHLAFIYGRAKGYQQAKTERRATA